jgi:hypothetical protein
MMFRAPAEPSARAHSDGGNMRDLPDDGEMVSIGRGKETGTPIKMNQVQPLNLKMILPSLLASRLRGVAWLILDCARRTSTF